MRNWIRQSERDKGVRGAPTSEERERIKALEEREVERRYGLNASLAGGCDKGAGMHSFLRHADDHPLQRSDVVGQGGRIESHANSV